MVIILIGIAIVITEKRGDKFRQISFRDILLGISAAIFPGVGLTISKLGMCNLDAI